MKDSPDAPAEPVGSRVDRRVRPRAWALAAHIEQRLRTWRQRQMNRSGDRLALDDFMGEDSISDLVDFVCDEYELDAILHSSPVRKTDCAHRWVDARNEVVQSGEVCAMCGALRPNVRHNARPEGASR